MPALDRRIIVRRTVTTRNLFGESVETIVDYPLWATRIDLTNSGYRANWRIDSRG